MPPHILIVDANTSAAHVTRGVISRTLPGATVVVVPTLEAAKQQLQRQPHDMLILDPSPDLLADAQFLRCLKADLPAAHVLVICSAPTPALRRQMAALGVDVYLEKPVVLSQFAQELRSILAPAPV
jgi:DNA-binding NarL/FixJ family response regulator